VASGSTATTSPSTTRASGEAAVERSKAPAQEIDPSLVGREQELALGAEALDERRGRQAGLGGGRGDRHRVRVERRRLPERDRLEHKHERDKLAQLGGIEESAWQMIGDRLDFRIACGSHARPVCLRAERTRRYAAPVHDNEDALF
jgi:hypothetical protein